MMKLTKEKQNKIDTILKDAVNRLSFLWEDEALDGDQTEWVSNELLKFLDVADAEHAENRPISDEFFKDAVIDDMCIDWLTGEYTGKRDRSNKREFERINPGDDGW